MKKNCIFCSKLFPLDYQIIYEFKNRHFVYEINPMRNFHCMLVPKRHYGGIDEVDNIEILESIGKTIKICIDTIKKSNESIKTVSLMSLNLGKDTKHFHFHLIPIFYTDNIKNINNYIEDGSGINFLSKKETIQDSYKEYISDIYGKESDYLLKKMNNALIKNIKEKVLILRNNLYINEL